MALNTKVIKTIIFDLDDTLFDTNGQLVQIAAAEACEAMIKAGLKTNLKECLEYRKKILSEQGRGDFFETLAQHFGSSENPKILAKIGSKQFHNREIKENISLFPETSKVLEILGKKYILFLVTLGGLATQKKKVELLKLRSLFKDIFYVDIDHRKTKAKTFEEILEKCPNQPPITFLSVGNRIDSEIKDAKGLGMQTLLLAHGEYVHLKPRSPLEEPDQTITNLKMLLEVFK